MKQLIQVAAITFLGFSACASKKNASVSELESVKKSKGILSGKLTEYQIDEAIPARKVFSSNVEVNFQSKSVVLSLNTCPPGARCIFAGPRYSADLISDKSDKCSVRTIRAETDARPVDGALTRLVIVDHSGDTCGGRPEFMLEVTLETSIVSRSTGGASETHSVLKGPSGLKAIQQN